MTDLSVLVFFSSLARGWLCSSDIPTFAMDGDSFDGEVSRMGIWFVE